MADLTRAELIARQPAERRRIDTAMLESLSMMRAAGYPFMHSFNDMDVSELLLRAAALMSPGPRALDAKEREG